MSWTDERKAQLKNLWADGLSASQIAGEMGGGITRNAVIGQVHRMGLSGRAKHTSTMVRERHTAERIQRRASDVARNTARTPLATKGQRQDADAELDDPLAGAEARELPADQSPFAVTFFDAGVTHCRWPIGDPSNLDTFRFCGATKPDTPSCPYCARHTRIAGQGYGGRINAFVPGEQRAADKQRRGPKSSSFFTHPEFSAS